VEKQKHTGGGAAAGGEPTLSSLPPPGDIKPLISPAV
jgi:hypothetical protein